MLGKKAAIELSLNFIVVLIISIILFGFGVRFISKISSEAIDITKITEKELDERIGDLICEGSDRVCIGTDRKTIKRAQFDVFGVNMLNILDSQLFTVTVSRPAPPGYTRNRQAIQSDSLAWNPKARDIFIEKNEGKNLGIGIQVPANAVSGTYIFNVEIKSADGKLYSNVQKMYVDVP